MTRGRRVTLVTTFAAITAALAGAARADDVRLEKPRKRQGYYAAIGGQGALAYSREDGESLGPWAGFSTSVRLGQLITPRLGLGLAIDSGGASGDGDTATMFGLGIAGQLELLPSLALHASVGLGVVSLADEDADGNARGVVGAAYTVGITYDWFPSFFAGAGRSGGLAIAPGLWARVVPGDDLDAVITTFGIEVAYWTGLPKNQLELPLDQAFGRR